MSSSLSAGRSGEARGLLAKALRFVTITSLASAGVLALLSPFARTVEIAPEAALTGALVLLAFPLLRIATAVLLVTGRQVLSQFLLFAAQNILIIAGLGLLALAAMRIDALSATLVYVAAIAITAGVACWFMRRETRGWAPAELVARDMVGEGGYILWSVIAQALAPWSILFLTGFYFAAADVGAIRVVFQGITIVMMLTATIDTLFNPRFAVDFEAGDHARAWRRHRMGTGLMIALAIVPIVAMIAFPEQLLALFGAEFTVAANALRVLAIGQLFYVLTGPVGGMMTMAGRQRLMSVLSIAGFGATALLAVVLMPLMGLVGAALAFAVPMFLRNCAMLWAMRRSHPLGTRGTQA